MNNRVRPSSSPSVAALSRTLATDGPLNETIELGIGVKMTTHTSEGGMILGADEGEKRTLHVIVGSESGETKVQGMYGLKK